MKKSWKRWKYVAKKVADVQAFIILTIFYLLIILPISYILKRFYSDQLLGSGFEKKSSGFWHKRQGYEQTLKGAGKQ